jgi:hypothetical protein
MLLASMLAALALGAAARPAAATDPGRPDPAPAPLATVPASGGAVAGRLVFRQRGKLVTLRDARRVAGGKRIRLDLRSGETVVEARLDDDGWFVAPAAPGRWVLEYLAVGDAAEFFDPPREVEVRAGEAACAGQLELAMDDLEAELGANAGSRLEVKEACAELAPRLRAMVRGPAVAAGPAARPVAPRSPPRHALEILSGLRGEVAWSGIGSDGGDLGLGLRGTFVLGLRAPLDTPSNVLLAVSAGQIERSATPLPSRSSQTFAAGAGYAPSSWLELFAGGDYLQPRPGYRGGAGAWGSLRLGSYAFGLGLRARTGGGGRDLALTLDLSPLYVIGGLL